MWSKSKRPGKPCGQSWSSLAVTGIVLCAVTSGCRTFYGVPAPPPEAAVRITPGIPAIPGSWAAAAPVDLPVVEAPPLPGGAPAAENLAATFPNLPLSVPIADSTLSLTPQRMVAKTMAYIHVRWRRRTRMRTFSWGLWGLATARFSVPILPNGPWGSSSSPNRHFRAVDPP
ncbi:MAG: hypothetical protein VB875_12085, partial [Pirellulales bacterium]